MTIKIVGIRKDASFKGEGDKLVEGSRIFFMYPTKGVDGYSVADKFVSKGVQMDDIVFGADYELIYDVNLKGKGKLIAIRMVNNDQN